MATNVQKKKKRWYSIYVESQSGNQLIGESLTSDINSIMGKKIYVNLMNLTDDPKKQNFNIAFKVTKIDGDKALADVIGYEMLLAHVKRVMRKGVEKIEDSFIGQSKDDIKVQVKPMLLTKNKVKHSTLTAIRRITREFVIDNLKKQTYEDFMGSVMFNKVQKQLKENVNKIYPIVVCEFRIVKKV